MTVDQCSCHPSEGVMCIFLFHKWSLNIHNLPCLCQETDFSPPIAVSIVWGGGRMRVTSTGIGSEKYSGQSSFVVECNQVT